uniref:RNase H type-1 domain-containing protein n=1 Tax=Arundo donax TaxID=35708 RepID=A0A0A9DK19_ARUDO
MTMLLMDQPVLDHLEIYGLSFQEHSTEFLDFFWKPVDQHQPPILTWQRPSDEYLKIKIDGVFFEQNHTRGWAFVMQDHHGSVMGSGAGKPEHITDAMQALNYASDA